MARFFSCITISLGMLLCGCQSAQKEDAGWVNLFGGKTLDGWKASENKATFSVQDGMIHVQGDRSHLFYVGPVNNADFTNFEWKADVMTRPNANSGMYIHTEYQKPAGRTKVTRFRSITATVTGEEPAGCMLLRT